MRLGWQELLIILVILVVIFGGTKIAGLGKASGRAIREFKDELHASDPAPSQPTTTTGTTQTTASVDPPVSPKLADPVDGAPPGPDSR